VAACGEPIKYGRQELRFEVPQRRQLLNITPQIAAAVKQGHHLT
jgi:hypothetical protein